MNNVKKKARAEYNAYYGRETCTNCSWESDKIMNFNNSGSDIKKKANYKVNKKDNLIKV